MGFGRNGLHGQLVTSLVRMVPDSGPEAAKGLSTVGLSVQDQAKRLRNAFHACAKVGKGKLELQPYM